MAGRGAWPSITTRLALCGLFVAALGTPTVSQAAVVVPMESVYRDTVYGEVLSVGNGNLRCPTAADGVNLRAGTSFAACAQAQAGTAPPSTLTNNNDYSMRQNDTDSRADTFNASSARFTIPAGASILYAELDWGGDTGEFKAANGSVSQYRSCSIVGQQYVALFPTTVPPAPAAASPDLQAPGLQVDGGEPTVVVPHVTLDSGAGWPNNSERFYTGWSDVTDLLQAADLSGDVTVTVSNVWAPSGVNCTAGWGLTVVWGFAGPVPGVIDYQNAIDIFRGHVRQGAAEAANSVTISGLEVVSSYDRIGLVAYEGDRGSVGDRFSINGTDVPEPTGYGTLNDFFVSAAAGATDPAWPVNFSTDVNVFETLLIPPGSTSATLGFRTNGDGFWMQTLWLETVVPSVRIIKTADIARGRPGDPVTWTITVTNPTPSELFDIVVSDPESEYCDRLIPTAVLVDDSLTYTCTGTLPDRSVTNTATVSARTELGTELSASASATVEVIHPALSVSKTTDRPVYLPGEVAHFTITITNEGDVPVTGVELRDDVVPACSSAVGTLAPTQSSTTTCAAVVPITDGRNTATATGLDPLGGTVTDSDAARVLVAAPSLSVEKTVTSTRVSPGDEVTFVIRVTNDGNVAVHGVTIADTRVPGCSAAVAALDPGESAETSCSWVPTAEQTFVNDVQVHATPMRCPGGQAPDDCTEELGSSLSAHNEVVVVVTDEGRNDDASTPTPGAEDSSGRPDGLARTGSASDLAALGAVGLASLLVGIALARRYGRHSA